MSNFDNITDPEVIGPGYWAQIHFEALRATNDDRRSKFIEKMKLLPTEFPCGDCRPHIDKFIKENPLEKFKDLKYKGKDIGLFYWSWLFHNEVNSRLGKYQPSIEEAYSYYSQEIQQVCTGCGNKGKNKIISNTSSRDRSVSNGFRIVSRT